MTDTAAPTSKTPSGYITAEELQTRLSELELRLSALVQAEKAARQQDTSAIRAEMSTGFRTLQDAFRELSHVIQADRALLGETLAGIRAKLDVLAESTTVRAEQMKSIQSDVTRLKTDYLAIREQSSNLALEFSKRMTEAFTPLSVKVNELAVSFTRLETGILTERRLARQQRQALFAALKPLFTPRALIILTGVALGVLSLGTELYTAISFLVR